MWKIKYEAVQSLPRCFFFILKFHTTNYSFTARESLIGTTFPSLKPIPKISSTLFLQLVVVDCTNRQMIIRLACAVLRTAILTITAQRFAIVCLDIFEANRIHPRHSAPVSSFSQLKLTRNLTSHCKMQCKTPYFIWRNFEVCKCDKYCRQDT